jgi:hypothetical protein
MPIITTNLPQPIIKKMHQLAYGEVALIVDSLYKGTLVWRTSKDGFTAFMNNEVQTLDSFTSDNTLMVRVLQKGDEVTLKF